MGTKRMPDRSKIESKLKLLSIHDSYIEQNNLC